MDNRDQQKKDAILAALLVFVVSGSIMSVAHGALFHEQRPITDVLGMVGALEPIAGRLSLTLFFFGTLSAGLSSVFPCLLIAPLLIEDYRFRKAGHPIQAVSHHHGHRVGAGADHSSGLGSTRSGASF